MIWLTWRQSRTQVSVIFAMVAVLAVAMAITGPDLLHRYVADKEGFLDLLQADRVAELLYLAGFALVYAVPPIIGAFWGAPLIARELEAGTHRLVWNQSVTRSRWLASKLSLTALAALVIAGLLSLAVSWWSSPIDRAIGHGEGVGPFGLPRISPVVFGARALVPIGYTAFALALGVAVGLVLRRSVPAIAVTLAVAVVLELAMPLVVRQHLLAPARVATTITAANLSGMAMSPVDGPLIPIRISVASAGPGDWMLSNRTVNAAGQAQELMPSWVRDCRPAGFPGLPGESKSGQDARSQECFTKLADAGYRQQVTYQPAAHFWALQWRETGLFLALALLLSGFCFWRIRRDLS